MWFRTTCVSAMLFALTTMATASPLDDGRAAVESSDYMAARAALDKALHAGAGSPQDVAEIYKLTGIVEAALGNTEAATAAFARWLELDAKGVLPPGTSPKIIRPFKAAAARATAIEAKADTEAEPPAVTLTIASDPQKLIASAHVIVVVDGGSPQELDGAPGTKILLPRGHRLDLQVQALDEHRNRVFELGSQAVPLVITGEGAGTFVVKKPVVTKPMEPAHEHAWYLRWYTWGSVAVVGAIVSGVAAYETKQNIDELNLLNRNSLDHHFNEAQDTETAGRRDLLIANIAAGATGAFALGAVVLYLTRPPVEHLPVAAVPMRGGGAIVFGGHF